MDQILAERLTIKVITGKPYFYTWCYDPNGARKKNGQARKLRSQGVQSKEAYSTPSSKFKWLYLGPVEFYKEHCNAPTILQKEIEIRFNREKNRILEKYIYQLEKIFVEIETSITLELIYQDLEKAKNKELDHLANTGKVSTKEKQKVSKKYREKYKEIRNDNEIINMYKEKYSLLVSEEEINQEVVRWKNEELDELENTFTILEMTFREKSNYIPILESVNEYIKAYNQRKEIERDYEENKKEIKEEILQHLEYVHDRIPTEKEIAEEYKRRLKHELENIKVER
jgi:hypothetical protein